MNRTDRQVIASGLLVAVMAGVWMQLIVGPELRAGAYTSGTAVALVDNIVDYFTLVAVAVALVFLYRAGRLLGGNIGRGLDVIGVGLLLYVPTYWLSYRWAIESQPRWLGLTTGFWDLLFGFLTLFLFGFITYGFYLIWSLGRR